MKLPPKTIMENLISSFWENNRIWWHGTESEAIATKILCAGFSPGSYFAKHLEDALEFGGNHIFAVILPENPNWQICVSEVVPKEDILMYQIHTRQTIMKSKLCPKYKRL